MLTVFSNCYLGNPTETGSGVSLRFTRFLAISILNPQSLSLRGDTERGDGTSVLAMVKRGICEVCSVYCSSVTVQICRSFALKAWKTQQRGEEIICEWVTILLTCTLEVLKIMWKIEGKRLAPHPFFQAHRPSHLLPSFSKMSKTSQAAPGYNTDAEPMPWCCSILCGWHSCCFYSLFTPVLELQYE